MKIFEVVGPDGFVYSVTAATSKHNANAAQFQFFKAGECVLDTGFVEVKGTAMDLLKRITFSPNMDGFFEAMKIALNVNFYQYWQKVAGKASEWSLKFYVPHSGTTTTLSFFTGIITIEVPNVDIKTSVTDAALEIAKTRPDLSNFVKFLSHE